MLSSGKQWHAPRAAFRLKAGQTSFAKRTEGRKSLAATKAKEKEMKDAKEDERQVGSGSRSRLEIGADDEMPAADTSYQGQEGG